MTKRFITILLAIAPSLLFAQQVSNIRAQQEGREIAIYYDLTERANVTFNVKVDGKHIKPQMLSGDLGKHIEAGERKRIAWRVLDERNGKFKSNDVVFSVRANAPWRTFVLVEGGISPKPFQYSAGLMVGMVSRVGWYVKARTSFQFAPTDGYIENVGEKYQISNIDKTVAATFSSEEIPYLLTGERRSTQWVADAGVIARVHYNNNWMWYVYAGGGYGARQLYIQAIGNTWLLYKPTSLIDFSVECGVMMTYKHFALTAGVSTLGFKYMEMQIGIGYIFN